MADIDTTNTMITDTTIIGLVAANEAPLLGSLDPITLVDTAAQDLFIGSAGGLSATDPDDDPLTYGLEGAEAVAVSFDGIDYDLSKQGAYGTLYLNSQTGAYRFQPKSDWSLNALAGSSSDTFQLSVSDGSNTTSTNLVVNFQGSLEAPEQYVVIDEGGSPVLSADAETIWEDALSSASRYLKDLLSDPNRESLLNDVFGRAGTDPATFEANKAALLELLGGSGLRIDVDLRSDAELNGALAAYAAIGHTGKERIYVNGDLLNSGVLDLNLATSALLEEFGSAIDLRLNAQPDGTSLDSPGDEGQAFASLVTGVTLTAEQRAVIDAEDDSATLTIEGVQVLVEEATVSSSTTTTYTVTGVTESGLGDQGTMGNPRYLTITTKDGASSAFKFKDSTDLLVIDFGETLSAGTVLNFFVDDKGDQQHIYITPSNSDGTSLTASAISGAFTSKTKDTYTQYSFTLLSDTRYVDYSQSTTNKESRITFVNAQASVVQGGNANDALLGAAAGEILRGNAGDDVLRGSGGSDAMTGGEGVDSFYIVAGDATPSIGGSGANGYVSGHDMITDFQLGSASSLSEALRWAPTQGSSTAASVRANIEANGVTGTGSTLTIGGATVKSHRIINGIIVFDDANAGSGFTPLTLSTTGDLAAVTQYLNSSTTGWTDGETVAFTVGSDSYVWIKGQTIL